MTKDYDLGFNNTELKSDSVYSFVYSKKKQLQDSSL